MSTILIVDDYEPNRYLLRAMLAASGHEVLEATHGAEALELARRARPDLIISDILMPQMDGFALCRECKRDEALRAIPFVFYTATYTDPRDEALGLQLGAARFIVKPVEAEDFIAIVREVLQAHAAGQLTAPQPPLEEETTYYRLYNEALIRKLEDKMLELESLNRRLVEGEERFRCLAENVPDLIYRYELVPQRGFTYVNPAATAIIGYTPEEHYADPDLGFKLVHPDDRPLLEAVVRGETAPGQPLTLRWVRKDGQIIWTEQRNVPIFNEAGELIAIEGIARDITERQQAEEALARARQEWQRTFDATNNAILILDRDQRVSQANKTTERFFRRPRAELIGRHCWEITHGTTQPIPQCPILRARQSLRRETMELQIGDRWFEVTVDPLLDAAGQYDGAVHIVSDITERKRTEKALRQRAAQDRVRAAMFQMDRAEDLPNVMAVLLEVLRDLGVQFDHGSLQIVVGEKAFYSLQIAAEGSPGGVPLADLVTQSTEAPDGVPKRAGTAVFEAWRQQRPIYRQDLEKEDPYHERERLAAGYGKPIRSVVDVPFSHGTLALNSVRPEAFTEEDLETLGLVAQALTEGYARHQDLLARRRAEQQLTAQLDELRRWHAATLGREMRILDLKREVNELLAQAGQPPRYPSAELEGEENP